MLNNFINHRFWKIHELETFGTRVVAMPESVQSCFELSIHFPVFFFPRTIFNNSSRLVRYTDKRRGNVSFLPNALARLPRLA